MIGEASADDPLVSVITVNFNGARYLPGLLRSLAEQTYSRFEVLLVDNGSTDESVSLVEREFPAVRVITAEQNLGFAGGNNLGIEQAQGDFFALINNDTLPKPDWLAELVETAKTSAEIGGVGSKILFARPFLPVHFAIPPFTPSDVEGSSDTRDLGVFVSEGSSFRNCSYHKPVVKSGFYGPERIGGRLGRWTSGRAVLYLPVDSLESPGTLELLLFGGRDRYSRELTVSIGQTEIARTKIDGGWQRERLPVSRSLALEEGFELLNNATSFLKPDGSAGDRGIFQPDQGQYDVAEDVEALCGCAMLLSRKALEEVGAFDRDFFMYFEDTELSWRLRKAGYRLRYQPKSVVRHFHASTSVEWSPLFNFLVSRNRILMLIKHASLKVVLTEYLRELYRLWSAVKQHRSVRHGEVKTRLKVQCSLLTKVPRALLKRFGWLSH